MSDPCRTRRAVRAVVLAGAVVALAMPGYAEGEDPAGGGGTTPNWTFDTGG